MTSGTTAAAVLDLLADFGVTTVFGLPGVHNLSFWDTGGEHHPRIVGVRHEQTTVYAADGLARATGGLGVALTTTGPGAANALAAFGEASASGSPVVIIASDVPTTLRRPDGVRGILHESADQGALFAPLAKAVYRAESSLAAVEAVARAVGTAMAYPRGPVYVGIPTDVLSAPLTGVGRGIPRARVAASAPPRPVDVDAALALIAGSARPVVWAGGGAVQSEAAEALAAFAARLGAPVVTSFAGRGLLASHHPLLVGVPTHEPLVAELIASADLMIAIGTAFDGMNTRNWSMPMPARLLSVNADARQVELNYPADVAVVADAALFCDAVSLRLRQREVWADSVFRIAETVRRGIAADPRTATAAELLDSVEQGWPEAGSIVCDMAVAGYWVGGYAAVSRPRQLQYPVGWGTLGYALPAAIGAAQSGTPTLVVCGDGGVAMALGELATLVQERLPVTVLVVDDGGYGMLRYDQKTLAHAAAGVDRVGPDWLALADAFQIPAELADAPGEPLRAALARAATADGPRLVLLNAALHPPRTTSPRWKDG